MTVLPYEILIIIYNFSDYETRININRAYKLSYKVLNPYKDYSFLYNDKKNALFVLVTSIFQKNHFGAFFRPLRNDLEEKNGLVYFKPFSVFDFRPNNIKSK